MSDPVEALVLDLLEWIGPRARPYAEVIDAWRTSCPRLPVWEEANARGYISQVHLAGTGAVVSVSPLGLAVLNGRRDLMSSPPILESVLTCPHCGFAAVETMPTNACVYFHECARCRKVLRPKPGDCCVFCSYGSVKCPSIQLSSGR